MSRLAEELIATDLLRLYSGERARVTLGKGMQTMLKREELVLAGLAAAGGAEHTPVQVQKLFFLIDKNIGEDLGGPFFGFEPYDYGPFDKEVYAVLDALETQGMAQVAHSGWATRTYRLTPAGQKQGQELLDGMGERERAYIKAVSDWVRSLSFSQLVSAIYKAYPEMQVNSVFSAS